MTEKDKFEKLKKLADAMYYAAQQLTTDASRLHKARDEYHQFIIHECKEEVVSPSVDEEWKRYVRSEEYLSNPLEGSRPLAHHFANWQKEQMLAKSVDVTIAIPYPNGYGGYTQLVDSKEALPFGDNIKVLVIKED